METMRKHPPVIDLDSQTSYAECRLAGADHGLRMLVTLERTQGDQLLLDLIPGFGCGGGDD